MKIMEDANYNRLMEAGYKLLTNKNTRFPKKFNKKMKTELYQSILEYYKSKENFEYCSQLSQSLSQIK